ncbi:MAG: hypothetical protein LUF27_10890 [Lachnospiraceae bacterium]|nr:hypothetical protein [Lachnospiraceae bacterium]
MIFDYMYEAATLFQTYPAVTVLQCCAEWVCFLWYMSALPKREWNCVTKVLIHIVFFGASIALHLGNYSIGRYFPLFMLLCIGFTWLMADLSVPRVIFKICPFGLGMEFSRLLCRDGILTLLLARFSEALPGFVSILISVVVYFLLLSFTTLWMRKATIHFEKLDVNAIQLIGFVFPLALYVIVRQYVFYYMNLTSLTFSQWLQLELLQLAILACAELEAMAAGQMVSAQIERSELLQKQLLAEKSHQQYIAQMQSIDTVNRRYHDLKHYLTAMETMNAKELSESVKAIREEVEAYECMQKTGNNTLDLLLAERIRECQKKTSVLSLISMDARSGLSRYLISASSSATQWTMPSRRQSH